MLIFENKEQNAYLVLPALPIRTCETDHSSRQEGSIINWLSVYKFKYLKCQHNKDRPWSILCREKPPKMWRKWKTQTDLNCKRRRGFCFAVNWAYYQHKQHFQWINTKKKRERKGLLSHDFDFLTMLLASIPLSKSSWFSFSE